MIVVGEQTDSRLAGQLVHIYFSIKGVSLLQMFKHYTQCIAKMRTTVQRPTDKT
jgi:hypothetical protein